MGKLTNFIAASAEYSHRPSVTTGINVFIMSLLLLLVVVFIIGFPRTQSQVAFGVEGAGGVGAGCLFWTGDKIAVNELIIRPCLF